MTVDQTPSPRPGRLLLPPRHDAVGVDRGEADRGEATPLLAPVWSRIVFCRPFPYETFKHVVYGPDCARWPYLQRGSRARIEARLLVT